MDVESQKELSHVEHWNTRYANISDPTQLGAHEWFRSFKDLQPFLEAHLPARVAQPRILHLGCGTSTLTAELDALGYEDQVSVDFSPVAIQAMQDKYSHLPHDSWKVMDVRAMSFADAGFDIAIDKGTLDAMLYGSLWDPDEELKANVEKYVDEVARVLRPGGRWLYVTFRQPHFLRPLLERPGVWDVRVETLDGEAGAFDYFGFVIEKPNQPT